MEVEAVLEAAVAVLEAVVVVVALVAVEGVSVAVATEDPEVAVEEEVAATSPLGFTEAGEIAVLLLHIQKKKSDRLSDLAPCRRPATQSPFMRTSFLKTIPGHLIWALTQDALDMELAVGSV